MAERTQYTPGTFSWVDLATTDPDAAKSFYGSLFGWEAEDVPIPEDGYYSMQRVDGKDVAAIAAQPQAQREAGVPPVWQSYVTVASADDAAQRASELGGTVHAPPFDVMEAGRMAVIQDPQGAFFMVWEPRQHTGARLVNAPGALCWNELASSELDASPTFYEGFFGWSVEPFEGSPMRYMTIKNGEGSNGGMRETQPQEPPQLARLLRRRRPRVRDGAGRRAGRRHDRRAVRDVDGQDRHRARPAGGRLSPSTPAVSKTEAT